MKRTFILLAIALLSIVVLVGCKKDKDFPSKEITITVPYSAGGGTDRVSRSLAEAAKDVFGKPVNVVNKTGGGGAVGMGAGAKDKADGHSVTMITVELVTLPHLGKANFTYENFIPVLHVNSAPAALTVRADAPWNTVSEFVEYAKNNPGKVKVGNSGIGAIWHLAALSFEKNAGISFNNIPYDGAAPAIKDLLGGHIDAVTVSPSEVAAQVSSGQFKMLGVMGPKRMEESPDVPTFTEEGFDVEISTWRGLAVPLDTPDDVVTALEEGFSKAAADAQFIEFMTSQGFAVDIQSAEDFKAKLKVQNDLFRELIGGLDL